MYMKDLRMADKPIGQDYIVFAFSSFFIRGHYCSSVMHWCTVDKKHPESFMLAKCFRECLVWCPGQDIFEGSHAKNEE
ncbi:hypothetical protein PHMEG_0007202 [Phytophthora megakarya]|uniref:Uncharacterized protein n=1 Tax=Phytophthora megakarya TaxID=4795 RepID=A0A225WLX8_9STRA|nr:hypothetical protein PHMEG_0007202 [Phytophthora megakarya]